MADCVCLEKCPFFNDKMEAKPSLANIYKKQYCQGDSTQCARYMIFSVKGKESVPADLYPNQADKAKEILSI